MYKTFTKSIKPLVCILSFVLLSSMAFSQTLKGKVIDAVTGDPLIGATVAIEGLGKKELVQLDGYFTFKNIKPGKYKLLLSYISYNPKQEEVTVGEGRSSNFNFTLEPKGVELTGVNIVASNTNGAERKTRAIERNAEQILNVVSSKAIQLLPDITVANLMQRVSGVTIERSSSGEGRYPIIRGMEKRYVNTLINGIKIPSPDNKSRFIPLDLFPSELLERLEVSKSLTPSMEGDAIGGTINLVMKDAPSSLLVQANFSAGYSTLFNDRGLQQFSTSSINKQSPSQRNGLDYNAVPSDFPVGNLNYTTKKTPINTTASLTIGDRFGKNKKLGFIASGSYQNNYSGSNSTFFLPNAQPGINNIPQFVELQARTYSLNSQRLGLNTKVDYQFDKSNKISLYNVYVRLDDYQSRNIIDTIALNSLIDEKNRSTWQYQSIFNTSLQGVHQLNSKFKFDWSLVYSKATNHLPDQAEFTHEYPLVITPTNGDILQGMSRLWIQNSDKDYSLYLNFTNDMKLLDRNFQLRFGGMVRSKDRDNLYHNYSLSPELGKNTSQPFTSINDAVYTFKGTGSGKFESNGNNYTFKEEVYAGYLQGKWALTNRLEAQGGVRVENTRQKYDTALSSATEARTGKIAYIDVLPSLQFKYALNSDQNLRASYYRALARPSFADMIPDGPMGEIFKERGNPQGLNHTTADNLDLRYELFPKSADQVLLGLFYKNIQNPIEYTAVKTGVTSQTLIPENFGTAINYGFEAVYAKYIGPFGLLANYTYTHSRITTPKLYSYRDDVIGVTSRMQDETRPMQGQSDHVANASLIYKGSKIGLDVQVAFVYTGSRISLVSPYYGLDYWQAPTKQLDVSFEKRFAKKFSVYGKVNNLTNTPLILELRQPYATYIATSGSRPLALQTDENNKIIVQKDFFKTSYLLGLRYKL